MKCASQHRMTSGRGDQIIVDVKDAVLSLQVRLPDFCDRHHRAGGDVVAQRLNLEPSVSEDALPIVTQQNVIRIDVESTLREHETHAEIVAAHRRMAASCERSALARTVVVSDVG